MSVLLDPFCLWRGLWRTFVKPGTIWRFPHAACSGHSFVELEQHDRVYISIFRCSQCGQIEVGWGHEGTPSPRPNDCEKCGIRKDPKAVTP